MTYATTFNGSCHCGNLQLHFASNKAPVEFSPRACDCSFCRKHGARYISDTEGALTVRATSKNSVSRYQQGSYSAEFLCCRDCGVLVAVIYEENSMLFAAVNAACLDDENTLGPTIVSSPQVLSEAEKKQRWKTLWISAVKLNVD